MVRILNLPNTLTAARIVIIPIFVTSVIYRKYHYALLLFMAAAVTDLLDGFLARITNQKTPLGTFLDPLADKFLLVSSFILFSVYGWVPLWLTIIVISRDLIVVIGWVALYMVTNNVNIAPVLLGKGAIALQLIALALVLLDINIPGTFSFQTPFFILTAALTAVSGLQYIYQGLKIADAI